MFETSSIMNEEHYDIDWHKIDNGNEYVFYLHGSWSIEWIKSEACWRLYHGKEHIVDSVALSLAFAVARELIYENMSEHFKSSWE